MNDNFNKLEAKLIETGYNASRRETCLRIVKEFFYYFRANNLPMSKKNIDYYLCDKHSSVKFWVRFYINSRKIRFIRLEKRLKKFGLSDTEIKDNMTYIRDLSTFSKKCLNRINLEDVDKYISANNISGDELLKVKSISKMFLGEAQAERKKNRNFIIITKKKEFVSYADVKEKLSHAPDIRGLIKRAEETDKHYCIKINTMVKVCRMDVCEFYAYTCPAHKPIIPPVPEHICEAHVPINFPEIPVSETTCTA